MINLHEWYVFFLKETKPESLDLTTEDVTVEVLDHVPTQNLGRVSESACEFLNKEYNKKYKVYPGTSAYFESKSISVVVKFNFRLLEE